MDVERQKNEENDYSARNFQLVRVEVENLILNCKFRSKDFGLRIVSFRAHIMRDKNNKPPYNESIFERLIDCMRLVYVQRDFSDAIGLLDTDNLTADAGEKISSESFRLYFKFPDAEEREMLERIDFDVDKVCGPWREEDRDKICLLTVILQNNYSKANFQLATINTQILLKDVISYWLPWVNRVEQQHDAVNYYNATNTLVSMVLHADYVSVTGGPFMIGDSNGEGGEGKNMNDQNHGVVKKSVSYGRSEGNHGGIENAEDCVNYLRQQTTGKNVIYYEVESNIETKSGSRRPVNDTSMGVQIQCNSESLLDHNGTLITIFCHNLVTCLSCTCII